MPASLRRGGTKGGPDSVQRFESGGLNGCEMLSSGWKVECEGSMLRKHAKVVNVRKREWSKASRFR